MENVEWRWGRLRRGGERIVFSVERTQGGPGAVQHRYALNSSDATRMRVVPYRHRLTGSTLVCITTAHDWVR